MRMPSAKEENPNEKTSLVKPAKPEKPPKDDETQETKAPYPKSVIFIIGNEFCERFSYYGMKTILTIYLTTKLAYSDNTATMIYHIFSSACYFTPIIGAIISDSFLGKFRTIFYISMIYCSGNIVLSISAMPNLGFTMIAVNAVGMLGLGLIAFGTGGIKPCVAAFGGDQFAPSQAKHLQRFFSFFYISINAGSLISTFVTPILRASSCLGEHTCFSLAFGVPAILMIVALILFLIGKPHYKVYPPKGNVLVEVACCIGYAIKKKCSSKGPKRESWLDYADDKYEKNLIEDIKPVLRVLFLYIPLPFFWALFDQQGSRWTLQATRLDGSITDDYAIYPDQMQVINPLLIILCVPIFEYAIYPAFAKINFLIKPLQRMTVGGLLASGAFVVAFFLQLALEKTLPVLPATGKSHLNVLNGLPCAFIVTSETPNFEGNFTLSADGVHQMNNVPSGVDIEMLFTPKDCPDSVKKEPFQLTTASGDIQTLMVSIGTEKLEFYMDKDSLKKPEKGFSDVRLFLNDPLHEYDENSTYTFSNKDYVYNLKVGNLTTDGVGSTPYKLIYPGKYKLWYPKNESASERMEAKDFKFSPGGTYIISITVDSDNKIQIVRHEIVEANKISLFLQIPQYVIITFGEVMFSITGLEFSYSQAPPSMKSVLQAGWLMTVAFGNIIVVIVSKASIGKQSTEFIMFAGLLAVVMGIFSIMAYFYKPVEIKSNEEAQAEAEVVEKNGLNAMNGKTGKSNEGFVDDSTTKM